MTAWQQVKPGDTVTISRTFTVEGSHVSEVTGRVMVKDQDFVGYTETSGWELTIVDGNPWHRNTTSDTDCGCKMIADHTTFEFFDFFRLTPGRKGRA